MKRRTQVRAFLDALRAGPYTSPGCYPVYFVMADGDCLSHASARESVWQIARATRDGYEKQWVFYGADIDWGDPDLRCAHSGERIESAYAEPDDD